MLYKYGYVQLSEMNDSNDIRYWREEFGIFCHNVLELPVK